MKFSAGIPRIAGAAVIMIVLLQGCSGGAHSQPPASNTTNSAIVEVVPCSGGESASVAAVGASGFNPGTVTVSASGRIQWTNPSAFDHTVTSGVAPVPDGTFDVALPAGGSVCLQFKMAGSYAYYCKIHPGMTGTITVN